MRKLFFLFLALVATTSLWAHDFEVDGIYYNYLDNKNVEVTYRGDYYSHHNEYAGKVIIPSTVTRNGITYSVTSIGKYAFYDCSALTSVTIGNSVTSIGDRAFENCRSLTSVTIPNSVTSIGTGAFDGCSSLTSPLYNAHCFAYMPTSYSGAYTIPTGIEQIAGYAFENCSSLTSIIIPNSVTSIGYEAFRGCSSLTSVTINSDAIVSKSYSRDSAISDIFGSQVTEYIIGDDVKKIGDYAFYWCRSLNSITIPNSVTSIGNMAFYYCSFLTKTNYTGDIAGWCNIKFGGSTSNPMCYSQNFYINDQEIKDLVIPNTVDSIHDYAFENCSSLTSVTIPNSVTSIGYGAFYECSALTSVTIPNSVTSIGDRAFYKCSSLTSVTIGNSVTSIGGEAFSDCSSLTSITCEATTPPTLGSRVFYRVSTSIPVYVPCGLENAYKAASGWKEFTNIQEPLAEYSIQVSTSNSQMGLAIVVYNTSCGAQISATANYGYHFVCWSDGNTDNPRTLTLTQDTVLTAEFALTIAGVDNITSNNADIQKIMRDGQLIILRDGVEYNAMGEEIQ